jgi:hypothetical protein
MKNLETYDVKHRNPRLIQNVTYLKNYEPIDLQMKKQTLFMDIRRETLKLLSQSTRIDDRV